MVDVMSVNPFYEVSLAVWRSVLHTPTVRRLSVLYPVGISAWCKQNPNYSDGPDEEVCIIMEQVLNEQD